MPSSRSQLCGADKYLLALVLKHTVLEYTMCASSLPICHPKRHTSTIQRDSNVPFSRNSTTEAGTGARTPLRKKLLHIWIALHQYYNPVRAVEPEKQPHYSTSNQPPSIQACGKERKEEGRKNSSSPYQYAYRYDTGV